MKKNIIIFLAFIVAVTVFLIAITYTNTNTSQPSPPEPNQNRNTTKRTIECYKNADCLAGGCSNHLCLPRDKAKTIITTCEWKEEYACYAQDSCVCRDNTCQWTGSEQFIECIKELR